MSDVGTIAVTVLLDADQFEDADAIEFFQRELIGQRARLAVDAYALDGFIQGTARG